MRVERMGLMGFLLLIAAGALPARAMAQGQSVPDFRLQVVPATVAHGVAVPVAAVPVSKH